MEEPEKSEDRTYVVTVTTKNRRRYIDVQRMIIDNFIDNDIPYNFMMRGCITEIEEVSNG